MAAGRREIGAWLLHFEIDVDVAPWLATRRDAAAEDDDLLDVLVFRANLHHLADILPFRREDAVDVFVRCVSHVPSSLRLLLNAASDIPA